MPLVLIVTLLFSTLDSGAGQTMFSHLRLPLGARAEGMGEAYTAIVDDATAGWWNAAALPRLETTQFVFNHCSHFQGINLDYLGLASGLGNNGIALGVLTFSSGELEYRESASEEPLGTFSMLAFHPVISYGRRIDPELSFGLTLVGLYQKIYTDESTGLAFNGGILYCPNLLKGLRIAGVFQNFGPKIGLKKTTYPLPFRAKLGLGYHLDLQEFGVIAASDYVRPVYGDHKVNTGLELSYRSLICLRGGYKWGYDTQRFSLGLGVTCTGIAIDYAYTPYRELGSSHKISLLLTP